MWSQRSIWSLIAVVLLAFDFFLVKGETPECSSSLMFKCWHLQHKNLWITLERKLKGTLSLKQKNLQRHTVDLKIILILQKGRFLLILFCKHVLIERDQLPRYGRAINNTCDSQQSMQQEYAKGFSCNYQPVWWETYSFLKFPLNDWLLCETWKSQRQLKMF